MARLARFSSAEDDEDEELPTRPNTTAQLPSHRRSHNPGSLSPSPAASFSSDKENHGVTSTSSGDSHGKSRAMPPPKLPTPGSAESIGPHSNKRRRLGERDAPNASQAALEHELSEIEDRRYYDPDQPMEERRAYRRGIRDLARELMGLCPVWSTLSDMLTCLRRFKIGVYGSGFYWSGEHGQQGQ